MSGLFLPMCVIVAAMAAANAGGAIQMTANNDLTAVAAPTFSWNAAEDTVNHFWPVPTIARRLEYVLMEPGINSAAGSINRVDNGAVICSTYALLGVPIRNQLNKIRTDWGEGRFMITLRGTDSFGEVLIDMDPANGKATAYSITIDRILKGGVSYPSPRPEEQVINRIGRFSFQPAGKGEHELVVRAVEEDVTVSIDGNEAFSFRDPDVAAGCLGIGTPQSVRVTAVEQVEYITQDESRRREDYVLRMNEFCRRIDSERDADIAKANSVEVNDGALTWRYPETGAALAVRAGRGTLTAEGFAGLYGNARMFAGAFALPEITAEDGTIYRLAGDRKPILEGDGLHWRIVMDVSSEGGRYAKLVITAKLTENATWFCTAEIDGIATRNAALAFGLDSDFRPNWQVMGIAGEPAKLAYGSASMVTDGQQADSSRGGFGIGASSDQSGFSSSLICTDAVVGHVWKALSGQDTKFGVRALGDAPALVVRSQQSKFRWALMWMPYHKLNLTGYRKRMLHFIRYPETPNHEWRERPSVCEYPTDEELERFSANGVRAMVWHHTWTGNNFRQREGFIVNEPEMRRALKKAHKLGIAVIPYIGIVPGRNPVLRYEDLSSRALYDKNWDLQDFTFYSVAGRFAEFLPYITDEWCREYGIDGFYTDGGLAIPDWGRTGLSEADFGGLSLEELNDRLYARVRRVLKHHGAGFGLENWGGAGIHLAGPWYDCRMIGEAFQETSPESYRDQYNPLLTATPFKMYGMDLVARNRYNVAMAAVCMTDIQLCSGNYAWGNWPDRPSDWANIRPFWSILDSIDWDRLIDAKPWWAQELVTECHPELASGRTDSGTLAARGSTDVFFAGHYTLPDRVVLFLANRTEERKRVTVAIQLGQLPEKLRKGRIRPIYPEADDWRPLGDGILEVNLPRLHDGPVGFEVVPIGTTP